MYYEDEIASRKADAQYDLDEGYISQNEYDDIISDIEEEENEYYDDWYYSSFMD